MQQSGVSCAPEPSVDTLLLLSAQAHNIAPTCAPYTLFTHVICSRECGDSVIEHPCETVSGALYAPYIKHDDDGRAGHVTRRARHTALQIYIARTEPRRRTTNYPLPTSL
ncbi:unnamed protein product [Arctia plantaginis]|uniref:Uncharacterized protein n=1 Tax=Arctia plantaginis TaxID=874455 RepID=A0A8S1AUI4_ARCPL|nr:unnamed protein product [Arctia plantaginis]